MNSRRALLSLSVPLAYGAGFWLVLIHSVEGGHENAEPSFLVHWLRDSTLALPAVFIAVWVGLRLADGLLWRRGVSRLSGLGQGVTAGVVAVAAGASMALGLPIHERLFAAHEAVELPLPLHMLRDSLLALFATVPTSALVVAVLGGMSLRAARDPLAVSDGRRTTRASFLKAGAGGVLTVASGGALVRTLSASSARAGASDPLRALLITEGYTHMADGSPAWMRGFAKDNGDGRVSPFTVPGPPIGHDVPRFDVNGNPINIGKLETVVEREPIKITVRNGLNDDHSFFIGGLKLYGETFSVDGVSQSATVLPNIPIPAGKTRTIEFAAASAGTYIYMDGEPIQRLLGLHGVMVVMPVDEVRSDGLQRPYLPAPGFVDPPFFSHQFVWVFHDVDPVWGEKARTGQPIVFKTFMPRFFTINGGSGHESESDVQHTSPRFDPVGSGEKAGTLIRIVNSGIAVHSPHFHGNHVYIIRQNGQPPAPAGLPAFDALGRPLAVEKDVFPMQPLGRTEVLLPFHEPLDQWPPYEHDKSFNLHYPMHCHAEMSQTAGGGQYPNGMYTEWFLNGPLGEPAQVGG